jgi:serine protease inhibitor
METDSSSTTAPAPLSRLKSWSAVYLVVSAKQKLLARCVFLLVILVPTAAILSAWPQTPRPFERSPEVQSIVDANTAFAVDLYRRLKLDHQNLFFSPYSVSAALAMTYAGARGQTGDEMARVLHFASVSDVHAEFAKLTERLNNLQRWRRITLRNANSIWCQNDYPLTGDFLKLIRKDYDARAQTVDFLHAPEAACYDINSWVSGKTDGKINDLIASGQITPDTRLVLCNAIYFKGRCKHNSGPTIPGPVRFT